MKDPEEKKRKPGSKPGVTPGDKEKKAERIHEPPGTITEVAPETKQRIGPIKEMAPDVGKVRPEVAPDVRFSQPGGPIQEMAPDAGKIRPEVAPDVRIGRPGGPIQEMAPETRGVHTEVAPDVSSRRGQPNLMYAPTIHGAIAEGNLSRMREVAKQAEQQLQNYGDLRSALEILKVEIAKLEHKKR